ncbi:MAG: YggS family pyridoxal phosphate-dependent enzyme [Planctomycetota bacterium]
MDRAAIIRDNLHRVQDQIAEAAAKAGRDPREVKLVGVTKYVDATDARHLYDAGCHVLGESRPQQLWEKAGDDVFAGARPEWHMIGALQSNKARKTVALGPTIHSVDSYRTLAKINKAAEQEDRIAEVLIEVNCSGDPEKHGLPPSQVEQDIRELDMFRNVRVVGLMTMGPRAGGAEAARKSFALLRELRDKHGPQAPAGHDVKELSMGMSGDFAEAIAEGATIVRIGSSLWEGVRPSKA